MSSGMRCRDRVNMRRLYNSMVLHIDDLPHHAARRVSTDESLGNVADISEKTSLAHLRIHHEILPPGKRSSPPHRHTSREEIVYILEGAPTLVEGMTKTILRSGDIAIFRPSDEQGHSIVNEGDADVRLLVASASPAKDEIIYDTE